MDADFVYLELPSPIDGVETPLVVRFKADAIGFSQILKVLEARRHSFEASTIATRGAPTQRQVDASRRKTATRRRPTPSSPEIRAAADALLRKLGMI